VEVVTHIRGDDIRRVHQRRYTVGLIGETICDQDIAPGGAEVGQDLAKAVGDKNSIGSRDARCTVRGGVCKFRGTRVEGLGTAVGHKRAEDSSDEGAHQSMARTSNADPDSVVISPHHLYIPDSFDLDGDELAVLSRLQARLRWDAAMDERPRAYSNSS